MKRLLSTLNTLLQEGAMNGIDPRRLIGEHNVNMKANEILSMST